MRNVSKCGKIFAAAVSCALCLGILLTVWINYTTAKYTVSYDGYAEFHPAAFNAAILGQEYLAEDEDTGISQRMFRAFGFGVSMTNFFPGMSVDRATAKEFPFTIANGNDEDDMSGVGVEYKLLIRTTRSLPLKFYLKLDKGEGVAQRYTTYYPGPFTLVTDETQNQEPPVSPENVNGEAGGEETPVATEQKWYECHFYSTDDPEEQNEETEIVDSLDGSVFDYNSYLLVVEWPIEALGEDNSASYMKEIDLFEVYVSVSSVNHLPDEDDHPETHDNYSTGIISIFGIIDGQQFHNTHIVDYRGFKKVDQEGSTGVEWLFRVDNAYGGKLNEQTLPAYLYYTVKLKTPYNSDTKDLKYKLYAVDKKDYNDNGDREEYIQLAEIYSEYRLYCVYYGSENYGKYRVISDEDAAQMLANEADPAYEPAEDEIEYRLYKVSSYGWNAAGTSPVAEGYVNGPVNSGLRDSVEIPGDVGSALHLIDNHDRDGILTYGEEYFKIEINCSGKSQDTLVAYLKDNAFYNKVEIITDAIYTESAVTPLNPVSITEEKQLIPEDAPEG